MAQPARERLLEPAATAEGSFRRHDGLLTALLSQELRENRAWRDAADAAGPDDPETVLDPLMERTIDFNSTSPPLVAGSVADSDLLLRRQQQVNREAGTGPQLAIDARDMGMGSVRPAMADGRSSGRSG